MVSGGLGEGLEVRGRVVGGKVGVGSGEVVVDDSGGVVGGGGGGGEGRVRRLRPARLRRLRRILRGLVQWHWCVRERLAIQSTPLKFTPLQQLQEAP